MKCVDSASKPFTNLEPELKKNTILIRNRKPDTSELSVLTATRDFVNPSMQNSTLNLNMRKNVAHLNVASVIKDSFP